MKKCRNCHEVKNFSDFWKDRSRSDGHHSYCKECRKRFEKEGFPYRPKKIIKNKSLCRHCGKYKNFSDFYIRPETNSPYSYCKECNQIKRRKRTVEKYGISIELYEKVAKEQNNKCKICDQQNSGRTNFLVVDHNHKTEEFRGLLCANCNTAIGMAQENIDILQKMINYLK
jgi:hypothetical protein